MVDVEESETRTSKISTGKGTTIDQENIEQLVATLECLELAPEWRNNESKVATLAFALGILDCGETIRQAETQGRIQLQPFLRVIPLVSDPKIRRGDRHFRIANRLLSSEDGNFRLTALQQFTLCRQLVLENFPLHPKVISLCLEVGRQVAKSSCLSAAVEYLEYGVWLIENTGSSLWCDKSTYELALSVYSAAAEANQGSANVERALQLVEVVLEHGKTVDHKLAAYTTQVSILGQAGQLEDSIRISLEVMKSLGHPLHPNPTLRHVLFETVCLKYHFSGRSKESILRLPEMTNRNVANAMRMLHLLFSDAFLVRPMLMLLVSLKMVRLTMRHGLCVISAPAFAAFGVLLGVLKDPQESKMYADIALELHSRYNMREWLPRTYAVVFGVARGRSQVSLDRLAEAHQVGKETGDLAFAFLAKLLQIHWMLFNGGQIPEIIEELDGLLHEARAQNHTVRAKWCLLALQCVRTLHSGYTSCTASHPVLNTMFRSVGDHRLRIIHEIVLSYMFGEYDHVVKLSTKIPILKSRLGMHPVLVDMGVFITISRFIIYRRRSNKLLPLLPCSFVHSLKHLAFANPGWGSLRLFLVEAELAWTRGKAQQANFHYSNSLAHCSTPYEQGVVQECYGRYYLERQMFREASCHMTRAQQAFDEMGAHAVARRIANQVAFLNKMDFDSHLQPSGFQPT